MQLRSKDSGSGAPAPSSKVDRSFIDAVCYYYRCTNNWLKKIQKFSQQEPNKVAAMLSCEGNHKKNATDLSTTDNDRHTNVEPEPILSFLSFCPEPIFS